MKVFYFYGLDKKTKQRVTVCGLLQDNKLSIGLSKCSKVDQFIKAKGRKLSLVRATIEPTMIVIVDIATAVRQFVNAASELVIPIKDKKVKQLQTV